MNYTPTVAVFYMNFGNFTVILKFSSSFVIFAKSDANLQKKCQFSSEFCIPAKRMDNLKHFLIEFKELTF